MAGEFVSIGIFGTLLSYLVLRVMAMIYLARNPKDDYIAQAGYDVRTDMEHGSSRAQYVFDPKMTAYWKRHNGWLVLGVARLGLIGCLLVTVVGFGLLVAGF